MNGQQIVDAVVTQGGFDTTDGVTRASVAGWAAAAYTDLVARSRWQGAIVSLGPTVAGEAEYVLPDSLVEVDAVKVDGKRYGRVGTEQLWDLQSGDLLLERDSNGAFAPSADAAGVPSIALFPTPTVAGLVIEGLAVQPAVAFADSAGFTPVIPEDYHWHLISRAVTLGKRLEDEADDDPGDQVWDGRVLGLRMRKNTRVGQGVGRLTVFRRPR